MPGGFLSTDSGTNHGGRHIPSAASLLAPTPLERHAAHMRNLATRYERKANNTKDVFRKEYYRGKAYAYRHAVLHARGKTKFTP